MKMKLTPLEKSWILYDVGNSAFYLLISSLIPLFFGELVTAAGMDVSQVTLTYWPYTTSISTILIVIISPLCGALADQKGFKKPIFLTCILVGIFGCMAMSLTGSWMAYLVFFIIANVGINASCAFYDSMLPEVTDKDRIDKVSAMGYAYGYIGSMIPFVVCLVFYLLYYAFEVISLETSMFCIFALTAVWWLICTIPLLRRYKQSAYVERKDHPLRSSLSDLKATVIHAAKHPNIGIYLLAFFFFINGVYTIIGQATTYGTALGLNAVSMLIALLVTQLVACVFSVLFGRLSEKMPSGRLMKISILCYTGITAFATFLVSEWQFWMLAVMVGMFQGGIQALSRAYLGKIIPAERSGSYYGLMDICGRSATALGGFLVGTVNTLMAGTSANVFGITLTSANFSVASLIVLFLLGFALFCKADKLNKT